MLTRKVGPAFHAKGHEAQDFLAESVNLDIGMTFSRAHHDLLHIVDGMLKSVFVAKQSISDLRIVRERWPSTDIVWLDETPILSFTEVSHMLHIHSREMGKQALTLRDEVRLGALVKEKYMTDYFIIDTSDANEWPSCVEYDQGFRRSDLFSIFLRGQEICTGGQWIHNTEEYMRVPESVHEANADDESYPKRSGLSTPTPSYGGASLSLEHFLEVFLELQDITCASMFHGDSRSSSGGSF